VERAAVLRKSGDLLPEDFPLLVGTGEASQPGTQSLSELEHKHIQRILHETGWNISQAARLLEIDRVTLYNKIRKYGIERP
jgi:two-component system response regulator HydG